MLTFNHCIMNYIELNSLSQKKAKFDNSFMDPNHVISPMA